ncbi:MAG TPA: transporter [Jatrophihabitans sp.]
MTRIELVVGFVILFALGCAGMWLGWRNRARRQAELPALPEVPVELGAERAPELTGVYIGTTIATQWQNRVVAQTLGERAETTAHLTDAGALIDRIGSKPIFIPSEQLIDARLEPALAGKVVGSGGLLVLRWQHGGTDLDTGLRADDKTVYPDWVTAIENSEGA